MHCIVFEGEDGVKTRFYPRIFTYSANYPEKLFTPHLYLSASLTLLFNRVLLASIHDNGRCPCPRCLMLKNKVHNLGTALDMSQQESLAHIDNLDHRDKVKKARSIIYNQDYAVTNKASEELLNEQSLVATNVSLWFLSFGL